MSSEGPISTKPRIAPIAGSFRPIRSESASELHPDDLKQSQINSKPEEDEEDESIKAVELSLKSGFKSQVSTESDPRKVSFGGDTLANSYGEREESVAPTLPDNEEISKESPINEELSIDEMIKKVEEKDAIAEESGNNYEVWPLFQTSTFRCCCSSPLFLTNNRKSCFVFKTFNLTASCL